MSILPSLLFALSANMDNFTVGIVYGIKKIKIGIWSNMIIAVITGLGTFLSMTLGLFINRLISHSISNILGSSILIIMGLYLMMDFFKGNGRDTFLKNPEKADENNSGDIDKKEAVILALALGMNNVGLGIGASITGLNLLYTTLSTTLLSIISIILGFHIGKSYLSAILGKYAPLVSAIVMILLGIHEMSI
ncbi:manganese efflux pump [Lutispora saccharofermentans]|uniref:Manganese efflux pump n=1 Tax=Lutispora saccharofermentans TaxID=3024236 RepID=A0ABT1NIC0_9FIRM|nr:manganese efflux pump [Lutispora saccharofermentans]MCQ1530984.1 manganese efflux pump [Lutispora saccharofermentans]